MNAHEHIKKAARQLELAKREVVAMMQATRHPGSEQKLVNINTSLTRAQAEVNDIGNQLRDFGSTKGKQTHE